MSYKCRTERITHYRAILNEGGFEKGDVESIVDNWYDINGNIYKSVENCIDLYYIREYTLYDEQGRKASIIRKNDKGDFENSTIFFRYDEAGHITKKLFYYNDGQMLDEDETEEEEAIRGNDNLKLEGWEEYQYNADFSSATVLMFELDEPPQLVFKRIESYDSDGELVESVKHYCGDSNRPRHIYVSKDETGNKIVTTEGVTVKNNWLTAENLEYENFKGQKFYNSNCQLYQDIYYAEGLETEYREYRYEYDGQGRISRVLGFDRNKIVCIEEREYDLNLDDDPEEKCDSSTNLAKMKSQR